jgi:hypothetical protein
MSNLAWSIDLQGTVFFQQQSEGTITSLPAGGAISVDTGFILGLGPAQVTVTAADSQRTADLMLLGPIVMIR